MASGENGAPILPNTKMLRNSTYKPNPTVYEQTYIFHQTNSFFLLNSDNPKYLSEPLEMQYKHIRQRPQAELYPALLQLLAMGTAPGIIRGQLKYTHSPEDSYEE